MAKINGVIPDRSLVTVDQWVMKFDEPVTSRINPDFLRLMSQSGKSNRLISVLLYVCLITDPMVTNHRRLPKKNG